MITFKILIKYLLLFFIDIQNVCIGTRTQEASYICEKRDSELVAKFRLLRNNDTIYQIIGHTAVEDDPDLSTSITSCADITTDEQQKMYEINITINLYLDTSSPECGIYTMTSRKIYRIRIRSQATAGIKSAEDAFYDFVCDEGTALSAWVRIGRYGFGSLVQTSLQPLHPGLSFWIMDSATRTPLSGEVELGRKIYYQIGFQSCAPQDTNFDTCGHEFWIGFQSYGDPSNSQLTINILNPSTSSISVQIVDETGSLPCSPVIVASKSFGSCSINASYEISQSSFKAIHVISPFQCIYVQRQQFNTDFYSTIPILPADTLGQIYHVVSAASDTEILLIGTNSTSIIIESNTGSDVSSTLHKYQTYLHLSISSDISGTKFLSETTVALFSKMTFKDNNGVIIGYAFDHPLPDQSAGSQFIIFKIFDNWKCLILKDSTNVQYGSATDTGNAGSSLSGSVSSTMEIHATHPILCIGYNSQTSAAIMPYEQWSNHYRFVFKHDQVSHSLLILISSVDKTSLVLEVNDNPVQISGTWVSVTHVTGSSLNMEALEMSVDVSGMSSDVHMQLTHPTVKFQVLLKSTHSTSNKISVSNLSGFNAIHSNPVQSCTPSLGYVGDMVDNNCNGMVDERRFAEIVPPPSFADYEGIQQGNVCFNEIKIDDCDVSPDPEFNNPVKQRIIENGCITGETTDPFRPTSEFTFNSATSDNYTKFYSTGEVTLVGFDGYSDIYLRCNVQFCSKHDSSCSSGCSRRKKRETGDDYPASTTLITLSDLEPESATEDNCFDGSAYISVITFLSVMIMTLLCPIIYFGIRIHHLTSYRRSVLHTSLSNIEPEIN